MLRAQKEWDRRYQRTLGSWNYAKHPDVMENFWREGVARNKNYESIITLGLRAPDDVTLLWAEDNWGNVRRLPTAEERKRSGGAGIYYHFDYHGGPRNYQWLNTSPLPKIWDQMSLAKQYGADRIWIVNVGHFKGYELPMEFFLNLGWNTERWNAGNLDAFTKLWAAREFGNEFADGIADILGK